MKHVTRESWYKAAVVKLAEIFHEHGYSFPKIRVGCGWPIGNRKKRIGECFGQHMSADQTYEIFVSPGIDDPLHVLAILTHELGHAIAGVEVQHKKPFREVVKTVGMVKPFTEPQVNDELKAKLTQINTKLGPYPHALLKLPVKSGQKGSRLLKVQCPKCEYVARVTRKWLDEAGAPLCPIHKIAFREEKK